jgi:hypothetical protein
MDARQTTTAFKAVEAVNNDHDDSPKNKIVANATPITIARV